MLVEKLESILGKLFSRCVGVSVIIGGSKTSSNNWNMGMGQNLTIQQTQQNLCIFRIYSIYIYIYTVYTHHTVHSKSSFEHTKRLWLLSTSHVCASVPLRSGYGLNRPIGSWKDRGRHLRHWRISFCFESQNGGMDGLDFIGFPGLLWCWMSKKNYRNQQEMCQI